ncbi:MAG TPA: thermonuclease family protein, partial [Dehalococcoidia bacterium]|nr:thermonuclease family protein [Dehalococcoidia bacterium]
GPGQAGAPAAPPASPGSLDAAPTNAEAQPPNPASAAAPGRETAIVVRVVDGDTIDVEIGGGTARVRYIGVDTPETVDPRRPVGCYGQEASARNRALVEGRAVELEKDVSETDAFGRLLRYVYVDGTMVNETLVREGYAVVSTFPPDVKYADRFLAAQQEARAAGRGLWGACFAATPTPQPAARGCPQGCVTPPPGCVIKGNVSQSTREKIYHVPGGEFYDATVIDPSRGERWFCTEAEALANGWRKSLR